MTKGTTKANGQKHALDKFYTKPEIAKHYLGTLELTDYDIIIEPSAGSGAFSSQIDNCLAFDLKPEAEGVVQQDWFEYERKRAEDKKLLVVGNPPFGQQNSLAIRFINHAAKFANTIAFILPKSFMKESVQNSLDPNLHLAFSEILPDGSFTLEGETINVPCVFQVWNFDATTKRETHKVPSFVGFSFVKKSANPDLFIQRVGGRAGTSGVGWKERSEQSNYFIKLDSPGPLKAAEFVALVNSLSFPSRDLSVGPRSLSKKELLDILLLNEPRFAQ